MYASNLIWISTYLFLLWIAKINKFNAIKISLVIFFFRLRYAKQDVMKFVRGQRQTNIQFNIIF